MGRGCLRSDVSPGDPGHVQGPPGTWEAGRGKGRGAGGPGARAGGRGGPGQGQELGVSLSPNRSCGWAIPECASWLCALICVGDLGVLTWACNGPEESEACFQTWPCTASCTRLLGPRDQPCPAQTRLLGKHHGMPRASWGLPMPSSSLPRCSGGSSSVAAFAEAEGLQTWGTTVLSTPTAVSKRYQDWPCSWLGLEPRLRNEALLGTRTPGFFVSISWHLA